ncbi:MAG: glycosyltransferase, partial [Planctomycetota bacterium]
ALPLAVVPHGRDLALRPAPPPPSPAAAGRLVLAAWGHLHPLKGQDLILGAIARLPDPCRVRLHLAGADVEAKFSARLRELARGLDVLFHGPFVEAELSRHPAAGAHAMVSGTRALESWGLVVDEAVALRMPVVLPRSGALPDRLAEGALFYTPRDVDSLAAALRRLLEEEGLVARLRAALPPLAVVAPSRAAHVERVLSVYEQARTAGPPPPPPRPPGEQAALLAAEEEWDRALSRCPDEELGFS